MLKISCSWSFLLSWTAAPLEKTCSFNASVTLDATQKEQWAVRSAGELLMDLMKVLPLLSRVASTRTLPSTLSHQQASFPLSMRQTIMSKVETLTTPPPFALSSLHVPSLVNTHAVHNPQLPSCPHHHHHLLPTLFSASGTRKAAHLELIQQSEMPPAFS